MSDTDSGSAASPAELSAVITLDEFCATLSSEGVPPEAIAGWSHGMQAQKRMHDHPGEFRASFTAWLSAPAG